jgi:hypothetical protein
MSVCRGHRMARDTDWWWALSKTAMNLLFYVHVTVHRNKFPYNKTNRCTNFPNLFWPKNEPLHVSGSSSAHHQDSFKRALGTGICHTI